MPAGAIHGEVAKHLTKDMVFNMQGSFVIQKIVTLSTHAELVALARTIMPLGSELMVDKTGPHLLMKVVDILVIPSPSILLSLLTICMHQESWCFKLQPDMIDPMEVDNL